MSHDKRPVIIGNESEQAFNIMKRASQSGGRSVNDPSTIVNLEDIPGGREIIQRAEASQRSHTYKRATTFGSPGAGSAVLERRSAKLFSPFWQVSTMQLPADLQQRNRWRRFYFQFDPFVGRAIEMHARYPLSDFKLRCIDEPGIEEEYQEIADKLDLFNFLLWVAQEYWVIGEAIPFGMWDPDDMCWARFILMNPDYINIEWDPLVKDDPVIKIAEWSPELRSIISGGPYHKDTGNLYRNLIKNAPDVAYHIKDNKPYPLHPSVVSHIARRANYFDPRGQSIIDRALRLLMYQDKLMEANLAIADRHVNVKEFYMLGEPGAPAEPAEMDAFQTALRQTWNSPLQAIVWNHALRIQMEGAAGKIIPTGSEMSWIDDRLSAALNCSKAFAFGGSIPYASATVAEDIAISEYLTFRSQLERWVQYHVFRPIALARGYTKTTKKELVGHYRVSPHSRRPILPDIVWAKGVLRRDYQRVNTLISLADKGMVPWGRVLEAMGMDRDDTFREIVDEKDMLRSLGLLSDGSEDMGMGGMGGLGGMAFDQPLFDNVGGDLGEGLPLEGEPSALGAPDVGWGEAEEAGTPGPGV